MNTIKSLAQCGLLLFCLASLPACWNKESSKHNKPNKKHTNHTMQKKESSTKHMSKKEHKNIK